jgi:hypothetical protein
METFELIDIQINSELEGYTQWYRDGTKLPSKS